MGYKLLGYVVWHGGKWYLRRRFGRQGKPVTLGAAALAAGGVLAAAAVAAGRRRAG